VFSRRENIAEDMSEEPFAKPISQPSNTGGPLSYADMVRKSVKKPAPPEPSFNQLAPSNDAL
jgi:hypothetical protein